MCIVIGLTAIPFCSFPGATNETLLQKFNSCHKENNQFYEKPQKKENAFIIKHYAGKVKYQVSDGIDVISSFDLTQLSSHPTPGG